MIQAFHDGAGARASGSAMAGGGGGVLAAAMLKPVSWTSSSVSITDEQV